MSFEMIPKQTIDVENANNLLDIYNEHSDLVDTFYKIANDARDSQTLSRSDLLDLYDIYTSFARDRQALWLFIARYLDQKRIADVVFERRKFRKEETNHDI